MKKETLEDIAKNYAINNSLLGYESMPYKGFIKGAKWQQEQDKNRYSEEEVKEIVNHIMIQANETEFSRLRKFIDLQFEQFKKL